MSIPGGRKFSLAATGLVMSFILALTGNLSANWVTIVTAVIGAFSVSHIVQDWPKSGRAK